MVQGGVWRLHILPSSSECLMKAKDPYNKYEMDITVKMEKIL